MVYTEDSLAKLGMGELWAIARKLGISRKGKKKTLIRRILKSQGKASKSPEVHAYYDRDEEGFICGFEETEKASKACSYVYEAPEIVEHLEKVHDINPDEQIINGWNSRFQREYERALKEVSATKEMFKEDKDLKAITYYRCGCVTKFYDDCTKHNYCLEHAPEVD